MNVIAPGFLKESFKINLVNNTLSISGEKKTEDIRENEKQIYKEHKHQSFKRSFFFYKKINAENISTQYVNGVLKLNLPKKAEVREAT